MGQQTDYGSFATIKKQLKWQMLQKDRARLSILLLEKLITGGCWKNKLLMILLLLLPISSIMSVKVQPTNLFHIVPPYHDFMIYSSKKQQLFHHDGHSALYFHFYKSVLEIS